MGNVSSHNESAVFAKIIWSAIILLCGIVPEWR